LYWKRSASVQQQHLLDYGSQEAGLVCKAVRAMVRAFSIGARLYISEISVAVVYSRRDSMTGESLEN